MTIGLGDDERDGLLVDEGVRVRVGVLDGEREGDGLTPHRKKRTSELSYETSPPEGVSLLLIRLLLASYIFNSHMVELSAHTRTQTKSG